MKIWKISQAYNKLPELVHKCQKDGLQVITIYDEPEAVVMSVETFRRLLDFQHCHPRFNPDEGVNSVDE